MDLGLKGKVAVVTGGTKGIGLGCAQVLAQEGANLVLNYLSNPADAELTAKAIAEKVCEIDAMINENATGWKTTRMNKVDLSILRLAVYEMKFDDDVPVKVAINEAVELAKRFSGDEGPAFINGVLGKLA